VARRPVAWVGAIVLLAEAVGIVLLNWFLGLVVNKQDMSLAGLDPHAMSVSTWIAGGFFGLYLALCGVVMARSAILDRAPGRFGRLLLISAAVVHALLGAFSVGLVGWPAFVFMMVVLGLIVLTLVAYDKKPGEVSDEPQADSGAGGTAPGNGAPQPA
jgi:MFS family permease